ncbi:dihydropyrimidinase [Glaciihabitans tibetensis]|uniref:Dihydropyrimidinase n=1 Tax=Glaciihabitans tibetensis TaxID=1266600 RepID=A0A2T0VJY7_9MICO|nr:amidohydrolase family protein [Glaciihabitans tibetensis]PRY70514.1 dihydropyrimidinase [Glaciihabitans tibetensis]
MTLTTTPFDLVIRGGTLVRPRETPVLGDVAVRDGRIAAIFEPGQSIEATEEIDATGLHVFPGSIDPHCHIGLGGGMDEYATDTGAAALGGVTTMMYMLSNGDSYLPMLEAHHAAADAVSKVDFGFHVTLMTDEHLAELDEIKARFGLRSFKYYMHFRGDEGKYLGVEGTHDGKLFEILSAVGANEDLLLVHAENPEVVWVLRDKLVAEGRDDLSAWDEARPPFVEAEAVRRVAYFANTVGCDLYLVHLSTKDSLDQVRAARAELSDLTISVETCPHYLTHDVDYPRGLVGKVNPPLRQPDQPEAIWTGLADGTIDTLGSDHVGRRLSAKEGTIWSASAGFPGAPTTLPVLLSEGYHKRGLPLERIAELTSKRPAELLRLTDSKGDIAVGLDADFSLVDLTFERTPTAEWLGTWSDYSLYEDMPLTGWPRHTILRGETVVRDGVLVGAPGAGHYVRGIREESVQ